MSTPNLPDTEKLEQIIEAETEAIRHIPLGPQYADTVKMIIEHVHQKRGKLVVSGMGKAGQIGMNIATTFCSTGTPAVFLHPAEAQHGDLGIIQPDDMLLLISNSGKTREVLELVNLSRRLVPGIRSVVITGNTESPLAAEADIVLPTGGSPEVCPFGLTPTTSTTAMTVIGDMLVVSTMQAIGFTVADYAKRHHGGYLGQKSSEAANR